MRADLYPGNCNIMFPDPGPESTHPLPLSHSPFAKLEETEEKKERDLNILRDAVERSIRW